MTETNYNFFTSTPRNIEIVKEINSLLENVPLDEAEINDIYIELKALLEDNNPLFTKAVYQILYNLYTDYHNMLSYEILALKLNIDDTLCNFGFRDPITIVQEKLDGTMETHHINFKYHIIYAENKEKLHFYNMSNLLFTLEVDSVYTYKFDCIEFSGYGIQFLRPTEYCNFTLTNFSYKAVLEALQLGLMDGVTKESNRYFTNIVEVRKELFGEDDYNKLLDSLRFDDVDKFAVIFHKYVSSIESELTYKYILDEDDEDYHERISWADTDFIQLFLKYAADYNATQCFKFIWIQFGDKEKKSYSIRRAIDELASSIIAHRNYELLHFIDVSDYYYDEFVQSAIDSYNNVVLNYYYDDDKLIYKQEIAEGNRNKVETKHHIEKMENEAKDKLNFIAWIHIQETPIDIGWTEEDEEKYKIDNMFELEEEESDDDYDL